MSFDLDIEYIKGNVIIYVDALSQLDFQKRTLY